MFSHKSILCLKAFFKLGKIFCVNLFEWDSNGNRIKITKSFFQRAIVYYMIIHLYVESVYQFYRVYTLYDDPSVSFNSYLKLLSHACSRLTALLIQTWTTYWSEDIAEVFNEVFDLNDIFKKYYTPEDVPDTCYKVLRVYFIYVYFHPITVAFNYYGEHRNERYWQSFLVPTSIYPYTVPFFAIGEFILSIFANMILIPGYVIVLTVMSTRTWVKFLTTHKAKIDARGLSHVQFLYRTLQVYNVYFNDTCAALWSFGLFAILFNSVLVNVCAIRLVHVLPFPGNMMFVMGAATFLFADISLFRAAGEVMELSRAFIRHISLTTDRAEKMFSRSCRILMVEAKPFFYHRRCTLATFIRLVMDQTIDVLLLGG